MKKFLGILPGLVLMFTLVGCGTSTDNVSAPTNTSSMGNMDMGNMTMSNQTSSTQVDKTPGLTQAFEDELNGFTTIQHDIKQNNYQDAITLANQLHNEFHAVILPPLRAKKGTTYAENIHAKYDQLQDAVKGKDTAQIARLVKVNRNNLYLVANILDVKLKK